MKKVVSILVASLLILSSSAVAFAEISPETYEQSPEYFTQENLEKCRNTVKWSKGMYLQKPECEQAPLKN